MFVIIPKPGTSVDKYFKCSNCTIFEGSTLKMVSGMLRMWNGIIESLRACLGSYKAGLQ